MNLFARKLLKVPLLMSDLIKPSPPVGCAFLIYHSVAGNLNFELDLPISLFRRQLEFLARNNCVISYVEAFQTLQSKRQAGTDEVVLTFDDGFVNFYTHVFPVLRELGLPATLFVTTGFVETGIPYPLLHHASGAEVKPVTWDMLGEMASSGLVTIGAHTHTHVYLDNEPEDKVIEELAIPQELFRQRLGLEVRHFAYPKALWNPAVEKLVAKYYASAVIGGGYKATSDDFNPYRIPRVPIRCSDGWLFFLAKKRGWLAGEEALYVKLRPRAKRQTANGKLQTEKGRGESVNGETMPLSNSPATAPQTSAIQNSLEALSRLYARHDTLDALLQAASQIAGEILAVEYCGIAWMDDERTNFRIRASFGQNGANGHAEHVNRLLASLVQKNDHQNNGNGISNGGFENCHKENALAVPLRVNAKVVGYLFVINGKKYTITDESLLAALGEHVGHAIEMQSMRQMLASSYLSKTMNPDEKNGAAGQNLLESHILAAVERPEQVAKLLARTFYRDLRKAGFETKQILMAATELIDNLNEALQKTRAKSGCTL